jgi:subtilisin family serine protease
MASVQFGRSPRVVACTVVLLLALASPLLVASSPLSEVFDHDEEPIRLQQSASLEHYSHHSIDAHFARHGVPLAAHAGTVVHDDDGDARSWLVMFSSTVDAHAWHAACPQASLRRPLVARKRRSVAHGATADDAAQGGGTVLHVFGKASDIRHCAPNGSTSAPSPIGLAAVSPTMKLHSALLRSVSPHASAVESSGALLLLPRSILMNESSTSARAVTPLLVVLEAAESRFHAISNLHRAIRHVLSRADAASDSPSCTLVEDVFWQSSHRTHDADVHDSTVGHRDIHAVVTIEHRDPSSTLHPAVIIGIASIPNVRRLEPVPRYTSQNNIATEMLQSETDRSHPLWAHGITGEGQIAGVGDTGLDYDHCFFDDPHERVAHWPATNPKHRKVISYVPCTLPDGRKEVADIPNAHGTHVSGSIAGNARYWDGEPRSRQSEVDRYGVYDGSAKLAKIFFSDLTCGADASSQSMLLPGDLFDAFLPSYLAGARVSSNSWGDGAKPDEYTAVNRRTDEFVFANRDLLPVFAAGNSPRDGVISPAAAKNVLTVGAHPNTVEDRVRDGVCSFSARGETFDHRIKPDVLGPGQPIFSARSDGDLTSKQCNQPLSLFGTSMACPHVAGSTVLVRQYLTENWYPAGVAGAGDGSMSYPTAATLKAAIIHAAHQLPDRTIPATTQGFGRLELGDVFFFADTGKPNHLFLHQSKVGLEQSELRSWCVSVDLSAASYVSDVRFTLVWTDPATAAEGSMESVVNDLDLAVIRASDGKMNHGNGHVYGTVFDTLNVVEKVILTGSEIKSSSTSTAESFTLAVFGSHVDYNGGQNFSLVATGPGIEVQSGSCYAASDVVSKFCPVVNGAVCSGHGTCVQGSCECRHGYLHVDCSACDSNLLCNGNGVCNPSDLSCKCRAHVDAKEQSDCSVCATGYYGPHCSSTCSCVHGKCDFNTGLCQCDANANVGFWGGATCDRCAPGRLHSTLGSLATDAGVTPCTKRATWCVNRETREVTVTPGVAEWFVINDNPHYDSSMVCRWLFKSSDSILPVHISFTFFNVENAFDMVKIYRASEPDEDHLVASGTDTAAPQEVVSEYGGPLLVVFTSDFLGSDFPGFVGAAVVPLCDDRMCNGHGSCRDDKCSCQGNFDPATNCAVCKPGYSGVMCTVIATGGPTPPAGPTTPAPITPAPATPAPTLSPAQRNCGAGADADLGDICGGHGVCNRNTNKCSCLASWTGAQCDHQCPGDEQVCSGKGTCSDDGTCVCGSPNTGSACQLQPDAVAHLSYSETALRFLSASSPLWRYVTYAPKTPLPLPYPAQQALVVEVRVSWRLVTDKAPPSTAPVETDIPNGGTVTTQPLSGQPTFPPRHLHSWSWGVWNDVDHAGLSGRQIAMGAVTNASDGCLTIWGWNRDAEATSTVALMRPLVKSDSKSATELIDAYPIIAVREFVDTQASGTLASCMDGRVCRVEPRCVVTDEENVGVLPQYVLVDVTTRTEKETVVEYLEDNRAIAPIVLGSFFLSCLVTAGLAKGYKVWKLRRYSNMSVADGDAADDGESEESRGHRRDTRHADAPTAKYGRTVIDMDRVVEMRVMGSSQPPAQAGAAVNGESRSPNGAAEASPVASYTHDLPGESGGGQDETQRLRGRALQGGSPKHTAVDYASDRAEPDDDGGEPHPAVQPRAGAFAAGSQVPDFSI